MLIVKNLEESSIILENDDLIAVNKPVGLASIAEGTTGRTCLLHELEAEYGQKIYPVHRLDKLVSGVILFARHAEAHRHLNRQFEQRTVQKTYLALVHDRLKPRQGTIKEPLRQFGSGRMGVDPKRGKPAETQFKVVEQYRNFTYLFAFPHTGRRHQIRVHLYSLGHPIVGDPLYGEKALQRSYPRLMLHAHSITVQLPSKEPLTVQAALPRYFDNLPEFVNLYNYSDSTSWR